MVGVRPVFRLIPVEFNSFLRDPDRLLLRVDDLQFPDTALSEFPAHHFRERTHFRLIDIRHPETISIQLIARTHGTYDRDPQFLRAKNNLDLCGHGIDGVDDIIIVRKRKLPRIFREDKGFVCADPDIRIDLQHPFFHDIDLISTHCLSRSDDLPVKICEAHCVIVDQVKCPDTAADQGFADIASDASYAENGNA